MKQIRYYLCCGLSLFLALMMLFFTFFAWGWFSDGRGMDAYFEIPVSTEQGTLSLLADLCWMAAPFCLILALAVSLFSSPQGLSFAIPAALPLFLYGALEILVIAGGKKVHGTVLITLIFLLLMGAMVILSAKNPLFSRLAAQLCLGHALIEGTLLILSFALDEKLSQFYFTQLLPLGTLSSFRYRFFVISVFLYYLSYSLALWLRLSAGEKPQKKIPPTPLSEDGPEIDDEETEGISLSLEDLGIER